MALTIKKVAKAPSQSHMLAAARSKAKSKPTRQKKMALEDFEAGWRNWIAWAEKDFELVLRRLT